MKQIGIIGLVAILIIFGSPLIKIKDTHQNMEYQEIGEVMLSNVETYVTVLDKTSSAAETAIKFIQEVLDYIANIIKAIGDFVKGLFEIKSETRCNGDYESGFTCGSSEGGGGVSFGGR